MATGFETGGGKPATEPFEQLLLAIQSGPLEPEPWKSFLGLFRRAMAGNFANLIFRRPDGVPQDAVQVSDSAAATDWLRQRYTDSFAGFDPIPYFRMESGRIYSYEELEGISELADDRFRDEFLRAADFEHLLIFRVSEPGGCNIWITITRGSAGAAFEPDDRAWCARISRAFVPALCCYSALLQRSVEAEIYRRAADLLSFGVITLNGKGKVVDLDAAARRRLADVPILRIRNGRLHASHNDAQLQRSLQAALSGDATKPLHLGDMDGLDLLVVPLAGRADGGAQMIRAMVYLSARAPGERDVAAPLAALFDLSATQARLAMLLTRGRTLAEAASEIGITEQTARTYSKEIFLRTGTTRQSELVQRILTSVVMLHNSP